MIRAVRAVDMRSSENTNSTVEGRVDKKNELKTESGDSSLWILATPFTLNTVI